MRLVQPTDMVTSNLRKRLSDFKYLFGKVEQLLQETDQWIFPATIEQANTMFQLAGTVIAVPDKTVGAHKRRKIQLSWLSVVDILRNHH